MTQSRAKGKRGELNAAKFLRSIGFADARRTAQHRGNHNAGDVECPESLPNVLIEVKNRQGIAPGTQALEDACKQAIKDADGQKAWAVLYRSHRQQWRLAFRADDPCIVVTTWCGGIRAALEHLEYRAATSNGGQPFNMTS